MGAMAIIGYVLYIPVVICWILVLIKMFQNGQTGLGILSIFCGIVAFIYGWVKVNEWNLKTVMIVWTACWALSIVLVVAGGAAAVTK